MFFFNDTATTEIYTHSLHDALPISQPRYATESTGFYNYLAPSGSIYWTTTQYDALGRATLVTAPDNASTTTEYTIERSEEHTSELQSRQYLVCRLLLEKKKNLYKHP